MHCEMLLASQIGFYSIQIQTLNTRFHHKIGKIAISKDFLS